MRKRKSDFVLIGYEGYDVYEITRGCFLNGNPNHQYFNKIPSYSYKAKMMLSDKERPFEGFIKEMDNIPSEGSIWVHSACKILRQQVYSSYKKVRDPWKADFIVLPKKSRYYHPSDNAMVAVNEEAKIVVLIYFLTLADGFDLIKNKVEFGKTKLSDLATCFPQQCGNSNASLKELFDATVVRLTKTYSAYDEDDPVFAVYNGDLPSSNIVYDTTLIEKMSENNSLSAKDLMNIYEMLISNDQDTRGLGLSTLANLPYANYKNSVSFILNKACYKNNCFTYHNAMRYAAVNAMLKFLHYRRLNTPYFDDIKRCDWKVLKQLLKDFSSYDFNVFTHMHFLKLDYDKDMIYPLYSD